MNIPTRQPTLDDVSSKAGVSSATVSRFLNKPDVVAKATGDKIRSAIEETGYIPNMLAGGLASSKSRVVSVLIPHLEDSIFNDMIEGMCEELELADSTVMLGLTGLDLTRTERVIRAAIGRRVDAIISTGPVSPAIRALVERSSIAFLQIWELPDDPIDIAIGFSHPAAGREIARFARMRGYERPHLVTADGKRAAMRRDGFLTEWMKSGGEVPTEDNVDIPSRYGHARGVFAKIRRLERQPDLVVCGSDHLAQGIIVEAQAAGLNVPGDLAIIGFGNSSLAGDMRPTITSVDIDGRRIAREAMAVIQGRAEGGPRSVDVGFRLIARESA